MPSERPIVIATRGSALALAQAHLVLDQCRHAFPHLRFEIKILKTTGDKLLTASMANPDPSLPKGLFTKELEVALLRNGADLAVHSLKDLPTELPAGLTLGAVSARADARDVLIVRDLPPGPTPPGRGFGPGTSLRNLPPGAVVATSSTRRRAQLLHLNPHLQVVEIRGNVLTRLTKLAQQSDLDATLLAAAGLQRLNYRINPEGLIEGDRVPPGLRAVPLPPEDMLPCVGQAALGFEIRQDDDRLAALCQQLNHHDTFLCVAAERAFLRAMGGGCQSPVAAYAQCQGEQIRLRAVSFRDGPCRSAERSGPLQAAVALGQALAAELA